MENVVPALYTQTMVESPRRGCDHQTLDPVLQLSIEQFTKELNDKMEPKLVGCTTPFHSIRASALTQTSNSLHWTFMASRIYSMGPTLEDCQERKYEYGQDLQAMERTRYPVHGGDASAGSDDRNH